MASSEVYRGRYGPAPKKAIPWHVFLAGQTTAFWSGWIGRHLVRLQLRPLGVDEARLQEHARRQAAFPARGVETCLLDYVLMRAEVIPYSKDLMTLVFQRSDGKRFELSERPAWIAVYDQLKAAQVPFTKVATRSFSFHVVHGRYGGEPIDRSFWSTRRALLWEREGIVFELREVIGRGPGLATLMALAGVIARVLP